MKIAIVVTETSGDYLGAKLIASLRHYFPALEIVGVAGEKMLAEGAQSFFPIETIAGSGIFELIPRIPKILKARKNLKNYLLQNPPDLFIGIDAPDFNLDLALSLKKAGIPTIQYVSPSVWAWRPWRVKKIKRAVDLVLALFPFEISFYKAHDVPVVAVGHPLADQLPMVPDKVAAKKNLKLAEKFTVAILPGSRKTEIHFLARLFMSVAKNCSERFPDIQFVVAHANAKRESEFKKLTRKFTFPISHEVGKAQEVMLASEVALIASGTATLECAFAKTPMIMSYRLSLFTYLLVRPFMRITEFALPNLLTRTRTIPEYIQGAAKVKNLTDALCVLIENADVRAEQIALFYSLHPTLLSDNGEKAAQAVTEFLKEKMKQKLTCEIE